MSAERKAIQEKKRVDEAKAAAAKRLKDKRQAIKERRKAAQGKRKGKGKTEI